MRIIFSDHARQQIIERRLSEKQIIQTIQKPLLILAQSKTRFRALKLIKKKQKQYVLVVIYDQTNLLTQEIVTAFLTSKIKKYL